MNEVTQIASQEQPTMKEIFEMSQESFNIESVLEYAEDAPLREVFNIVEDVKEAMQRKIDRNENTLNFPITVHFHDTKAEVEMFFVKKGFTDAMVVDIEEEDSKRTEVVLTW